MEENCNKWMYKKNVSRCLVLLGGVDSSVYTKHQQDDPARTGCHHFGTTDLSMSHAILVLCSLINFSKFLPVMCWMGQNSHAYSS